MTSMAASGRSGVLCRLLDLQSSGVLGTQLPQPGARWPQGVIVVATSGGIRAYRNCCPHMGTPLETFPGEFLDRETGDLVCSTHGARFRVSDGLCLSGPCVGSRLAPVEVAIEDGAVILAAARP